MIKIEYRVYKRLTAAVVAVAFLVTAVPGQGYSLAPSSKFEGGHTGARRIEEDILTMSISLSDWFPEKLLKRKAAALGIRWKNLEGVYLSGRVNIVSGDETSPSLEAWKRQNYFYRDRLKGGGEAIYIFQRFITHMDSEARAGFLILLLNALAERSDAARLEGLFQQAAAQFNAYLEKMREEEARRRATQHIPERAQKLVVPIHITQLKKLLDEKVAELEEEREKRLANGEIWQLPQGEITTLRNNIEQSRPDKRRIAEIIKKAMSLELVWDKTAPMVTPAFEAMMAAKFPELVKMTLDVIENNISSITELEYVKTKGDEVEASLARMRQEGINEATVKALEASLKRFFAELTREFQQVNGRVTIEELEKEDEHKKKHVNEYTCPGYFKRCIDPWRACFIERSRVAEVEVLPLEAKEDPKGVGHSYTKATVAFWEEANYADYSLSVFKLAAEMSEDLEGGSQAYTNLLVGAFYAALSHKEKKLDTLTDYILRETLKEVHGHLSAHLNLSQEEAEKRVNKRAEEIMASTGKLKGKLDRLAYLLEKNDPKEKDVKKRWFSLETKITLFNIVLTLVLPPIFSYLLSPLCVLIGLPAWSWIVLYLAMVIPIVIIEHRMVKRNANKISSFLPWVFLAAATSAAAFGDPSLLAAGLFFGGGLSGDDLDKAASGIREGRVGISRAVKILKDNDYPEVVERAIWDALGRVSYDEALVVLNMHEGKQDKAINCRARLFARVLERLEHLLAADKLIEISEDAGKSALPHLRNLALRGDLDRGLRIKVQTRIFDMARDTSRPDLSDAAEGAVVGIGFDNMEYETLVGIFLSGVFRDKYRLVLPDPYHENRFVNAMKDGIDKLTPEQIRHLNPAVKGEYANRIARRLEGLCLNEDTADETIGVLLDFNKEYPLDSLNVLARLSTDERISLSARNGIQKRIIDLHSNKNIEVRAALRENAPLIEYDSFEFEGLVYADSKGVQPVRVKLALARRLINLSLEEIAGLSPRMRSEFKMTIAKRLTKLTLQGQRGALEALLDFSGEHGIYTAGSFRNVFKKFESNAERTRFILERVIELNFKAENEKSRSAMGAVIDAYGPHNIPMSLLLNTVRSERFRGPEQGRYSRALEKKFLPVKIAEVLQAMREIKEMAKVVELGNILSTIAEKIDAQPAGVSLLQFAQSDNAEERLASVEPLCSMLRRRDDLTDDARASIEAQLMQFVLEDKDKLVREKSRDAFARIGLGALSLKTLLYAYEKGAAIDELAPSIEAELKRRLAGFKKAKDILKAVEENKSYASIFIRHLGALVASTGDIEALSALEHILKDDDVSLSDKFSAIHPLCLAAVNATFDRTGVRNVVTGLAVGLMKHLDIKEDAKALSARAISSLEEALLDSNTPLPVRTRLLEYFTRSKNEIIKKREFLRSLLARAPNRPLTNAEVSFYDVIVKATKPLLDAPSLPHLFRLYENTDDPKLRRHVVRNIGLIRQAAASSDKLHGYLASAVSGNLDEELTKELIWANGEIENKKAEGFLIAILKDNSKPEDMRKACAVALGKISYDRGLIATISRIALSLGWEDEVLEGIRSGIEYRFSWRATADERSAQLLDEIYRLHEKGQLEEVFGKEARGLKDYLDNVKAGIGGDEIALYLPGERFIVRGVITTEALADIIKRGVQKPLKDTAGASYAEQGESYFSRTLDYVLGGFTSESGAVMFVPTEFYNEELSLGHVKLGKRVVGIFVFSEGVPREKIRFIFMDTRLFKEMKKVKEGSTSSIINVTADDLSEFDLVEKDEISEEAIVAAVKSRHCKVIEVKRKDGESYESAVRRLLDSSPLKSHLKRAKEERLQELTVKGYAQRWLSNNRINSEWWHQLAKGRRLKEDLGELSEGSLGSHAGGWAKHKKTGARYYVKFLDDVDQLRAEYVAWRFYKELGFNVSDEMYLVRSEFGGRQRWALVSKEIDGFKSGLDEELFHHKKVVERYLADCWLQNRDGPKNDNNGLNRSGEPACLDFGSSLDCRAKARERKEFTVASMVELMDTFFDPSLSVDPTFFRHATYDDKVASARRISQLSDDTIRSIVYSAGYEDASARDAIISTLIDSKYFLMGKFKIGGEESMEALYDLFSGSDEEFAYKMKGFNRFVPFEIKELMSKPSGRSKGKTIWDHTIRALERLDTEDVPVKGDLDLRRIVRAVVFMHDIGKAYGHEDHEKRSAQLMVKYLPQMGFSRKEILVALEVMRKNQFGDILLGKIPIEEFALLAVHKTVADVVNKPEVFAMSLAYYMADVTSGRRLKEQVTEKGADGRRYIKEEHKNFYELVRLMEQKEAARALADSYNGAMLDIDGTITEAGELDTSVVVRIAHLLRGKVFVALATGRQGDKEEIESLIKALTMRGLTERDLAYLRIFTDNGAICFLGNGELDEGYLNQWPKNYPKDKAEKFLEGLFKKIKGIGRFEIKPREFYIRIKVEDANAFFVARQLNQVIKNMSLPLKITVSGKGSIDVAPIDVHKGRALQYFREVISELGRQDLKEVKVLTIGNRGEPEGNDYPMLTEGVGFTVGGKRKDSLAPLRVYKGKGDALQGSDGTVWLLENAKFKPSSVDPASFELLECRDALARAA